MLRQTLIFAFAVLISSSAISADNGGFGAAFNNNPPSALAETPNSEIAQSVQDPSVEDLQNIMPAAGDETGASQTQPVPLPGSMQAETPEAGAPKQ